MTVLIRCLVFIFAISLASCGPPKVCSGLNPEIGKYNTSKKIRKGKRSLHSGPEKDAYHRRSQQIKKNKRRAGASNPKKHGIFSIHLGGRSKRSGGGGGGGNNDNVQQQQRN